MGNPTTKLNRSWWSGLRTPPHVSTSLTRPLIKLHSLRGNREVAGWIDTWLLLLNARLPPTPGEPVSLFPEERTPAEPGRLLPEGRLTLSSLDEGFAEQAHYAVGHTFTVLQSENGNPERTAARLMGDATLGRFLAAYNGVQPDQWRAGLRIFLPAYVDRNPAHVAQARAIGGRKPASTVDRQRLDASGLVPSCIQGVSLSMKLAKVSVAIGDQPMLVRVSRYLGVYELSPEAARFLTEFLLKGFNSKVDVRKIDFVFKSHLRWPRDIAVYIPATPGNMPRRPGSIATVVIYTPSDWDQWEWNSETYNMLAAIAYEIAHSAQHEKLGAEPFLDRMERERKEYYPDQLIIQPYEQPVEPFENLDPVDPRRPLAKSADAMRDAVLKELFARARVRAR